MVNNVPFEVVALLVVVILILAGLLGKAQGEREALRRALVASEQKSVQFPSTNFDDVGDFHQKFGLENVTHGAAHPRHMPFELVDFRVRFMQEELDEYVEATGEGDDVKAFDALLDLAYVVFGTAHLHGFPWQAGWDAVQRANMSKVRAQRATDSKRGSSFDVIKPYGWTPPDVAGVLRRHGWTDLAGPSETGV